jgi:hypothetical protein
VVRDVLAAEAPFPVYDRMQLGAQVRPDLLELRMLASRGGPEMIRNTRRGRSLPESDDCLLREEVYSARA